jgi:hypothetical protein
MVKNMPFLLKIFFITIIAKTLQLAFNHLSPSDFLDFEGSNKGIRISGSRATNSGKKQFVGSL